MRPTGTSDQGGFALLQVLVAVAILGILAATYSALVAQTMHAQQIARVRGERVDLRAVFRGSLICATACDDQNASVPTSVGRWMIKLDCGGPLPVVMAKNQDLDGGLWSPLYLPGEAAAVCKQVAPQPTIAVDLLGTQPTHRRTCPTGEVVKNVDFVRQDITCH